MRKLKRKKRRMRRVKKLKWKFVVTKIKRQLVGKDSLRTVEILLTDQMNPSTFVCQRITIHKSMLEPDHSETSSSLKRRRKLLLEG